MTTATATNIQPGTWSVDPVHSAIAFSVRHFGVAWVRGSFTEFTAEFVAGDDGGYQLTGSAPVKAIDFTNEQLVGHLMSPDFFDEQLHPSVEFRSTGVDLGDRGEAVVRGELTMRGITREVELRGEYSTGVGMADDQRLGFLLQGEIDRMDWASAGTPLCPTAAWSSSRACASRRRSNSYSGEHAHPHPRPGRQPAPRLVHATGRGAGDAPGAGGTGGRRDGGIRRPRHRRAVRRGP